MPHRVMQTVVDPIMVEVLRGLSPEQRLATLDALWRSARQLVAAGVRRQHPDWTDPEIDRETAARLSGDCSGGD